MPGLVAEFPTADDLLVAIQKLVREGYTRLDTFTPHPIHGLEEALGQRRSRMALLVFPFSVAGLVFALVVQWYCNAFDYPLNVGGRPAFALPAFVPIIFETTVLASGFAALLGLIWVIGLPRLSDPLDDVPGIERARVDTFWLNVDAADARYDAARTRLQLVELGASRVESVT
jgi:hypothetical protein